MLSRPMISEPPTIHTDVRQSVAVPSTQRMSYDFAKPSPYKGVTEVVHKPSEVYSEYTNIQSSPAKKETALTNMFLK